MFTYQYIVLFDQAERVYSVIIKLKKTLNYFSLLLQDGYKLKNTTEKYYRKKKVLYKCVV